MFVFAGTDDCIEDRRRGLYSYEALATRLAPNRFATEGRADFSSPVMKLESLTPEDCYVLLDRIRGVFAMGDSSKYLVPEEGIREYLKGCSERMGAAYFQTPRDTVRDFVGLLKVLEQNPSQGWHDLLAERKSSPERRVSTKPREKSAGRDVASPDDLSEFRL